MNRTLTAGTLLTGLLLAACASTPSASPTLVEARATVRSAELDPAVQANAPLELKRANDSLSRANDLFARGEPLGDINSAAYVASQQARTATAIAQAKSNDTALAMSQVDRERARADVRTSEAERAQAQAGAASQQAALATKQAATARADTANAQQQTAMLQQRLDELQAQQTERGMLVTLGDVLFEFNRADVKPSGQASLRKLADFLQQYPSRQVLIEGYTDDIGAPAYNVTLSQRRAEAVDSALAGMGVAPQRMATVGYGEEFPVAVNNTDTNRALNRRVEVTLGDNDLPVRSRR